MSAAVEGFPPAESDAILGKLPDRVFEPASAEELAEIVASTQARELVLAPLGSATSLGIGNPLERYDAAIRMRRLNRVVEYAPEDQVVVVEAGVTLDELQQVLWTNQQRLAIDPPGGDRMTIGGMLATNAYGPSSLRYGTLKDLIVGVEAVRADGAIVHGGGKVVKNVAGFDLPKLLVGSLGTLAIVTKATFRVHPLAPARQSISVRLTAASIFPFVLALREAQLEPCSIVAVVEDANEGVRSWQADVAFEGFEAGVDAQIAASLDIARARGEVGAGGSATAFPVEFRDEFVAKASFRPASFERIAGELAQAGLRLRALPARGTIEIGGSATQIGDPQAAVARMRALFASFEGTLAVTRMPRDWYDRIDPWGSNPGSFALMQSLKDRFDPQRRLNRGRFIGGI